MSGRNRWARGGLVSGWPTVEAQGAGLAAWGRGLLVLGRLVGVVAGRRGHGRRVQGNLQCYRQGRSTRSSCSLGSRAQARGAGGEGT
jgi:hypothetical protein